MVTFTSIESLFQLSFTWVAHEHDGSIIILITIRIDLWQLGSVGFMWHINIIIRIKWTLKSIAGCAINSGGNSNGYKNNKMMRNVKRLHLHSYVFALLIIDSE